MDKRDILEKQLEEIYDLAKECKSDMAFLRHLFSKFTMTLAALWYICGGTCENLVQAELEELTYIYSFSKAERLVEDQWVLEGLYQIHPEWNIKETFKPIYDRAARSGLIMAAQMASKK